MDPNMLFNDMRRKEMVYRTASAKAMRVAVVGAGLSGLIAAQTLKDSGHNVCIFEKARGVGGRMSTRRTEIHAFDHGAQYFTVRDPRFFKRVENWLASGIVRPWEGRMGVVRGDRIQKERRYHRRIVGVPGMSAVARHLSNEMDIRWSTRVAGVSRKEGSTLLSDKQGAELGIFDAVILTPPPEQSAQLLAGHHHLAARLKAIQMTPCWAVMLAFKEPLDVSYDGLFIHGSEVVWAARNSSKPGRPDGECWVLHADAAWSSSHFHLSDREAIEQLTAAFFDAVQHSRISPTFAIAHRWRYAQVKNPLNVGALWDAETMIGACGDWCNGSRIEGAYLSGAAIAERVLSL